MKFLDVPQSGSWAGNTHSHNRAGQYRRNRRTPVNTIGNGRRAFIRSAFGTSAKAWGSLTDAQRAAWTSYSNEYPRVDKLGQSFTLSGAQMFNAININLINVGQTTTETPPASNDVPDVSGGSFTAVVATGVLTLTFSGLDGGNPSDFWIVGMSAPVSAGVSFMKTFTQLYSGEADDDPAITAAIYEAQFGLPAVGQRIFARLAGVNEYGVRGTPRIISTIVAS
jgi:hypothetical protein